MILKFLTPLVGGLSQLAAASEEADLFGDEAEGLLATLGTTPFWPTWSSIWEMVIRLVSPEEEEALRKRFPKARINWRGLSEIDD